MMVPPGVDWARTAGAKKSSARSATKRIEILFMMSPHLHAIGDAGLGAGRERRVPDPAHGGVALGGRGEGLRLAVLPGDADGRGRRVGLASVEAVVDRHATGPAGGIQDEGRPGRDGTHGRGMTSFTISVVRHEHAVENLVPGSDRGLVGKGGPTGIRRIAT